MERLSNVRVMAFGKEYTFDFEVEGGGRADPYARLTCQGYYLLIDEDLEYLEGDLPDSLWKPAIDRMLELNVVEAMVENRIMHIVYTSMVQARPNAIFQGTATQYHTEELIKESGIPYTFFRNSMYMEAISELIGDAVETNIIRYPSGNGRVNFVSRADIAEAIANVLTAGDHSNQTYEITGVRAYTFAELAKLIHPEMKHLDIADSIFRQELVDYQLSGDVVSLLSSMADGIKHGEFSHTSYALEGLLGRKPLGLKEFFVNSYRDKV